MNTSADGAPAPVSVPSSTSPSSLEARIHAAGRQLVMATTGGGASAIARLLGVPGGSKSVLEALVPYSPAALDDFLRARPEQYCSARTARAMSMVAFERARRWARSNDSTDTTAGDQDHDQRQGQGWSGTLVGVSCTASLASDRPKRGPHRAHFAAQSDRATLTWTLHLAAGARSRAEEESLVGETLIQVIAVVAGILPAIELPGLRGDESLDHEHVEAPPAWRSLLMGHLQAVPFAGSSDELLGVSPRVVSSESERSTSVARPHVVFPGAFNPLHDGHRRMAAIAERRCQAAVAYELSIENVDKPPLDFAEIAVRGRQFDEPSQLWLTRAPTFVEKARLFPRSVFVVGADTIERIANPKYYGGSSDACRAAIAEIGQRGCRFLVFGRQTAAGFQTLQSLALPASLRELCDYVAESEFREDVSSTELRRRASAASDENSSSAR